MKEHLTRYSQNNNSSKFHEVQYLRVKTKKKASMTTVTDYGNCKLKTVYCSSLVSMSEHTRVINIARPTQYKKNTIQKGYNSAYN